MTEVFTTEGRQPSTVSNLAEIRSQRLYAMTARLQSAVMVKGLAAGVGIALLALQAGHAQTAPRTGLLFDELYLRHLAGDTGHPERPERLNAVLAGLDKAGLLKDLGRVPARPATDDELALAHDRGYIELVKRELANVTGVRQLSTGDTDVTAGSLIAARAAAGGVLNAADAVASGRMKNAFCAVRPPGHHATRNRGMGFCIFNNIAIGAWNNIRIRVLSTINAATKLQPIITMSPEMRSNPGTLSKFTVL